MPEKEKLEQAAYNASWQLVWLVERGHVTDIQSIALSVKFIESYSDLYADENCRVRAQKLREGK